LLTAGEATDAAFSHAESVNCRTGDAVVEEEAA
jgi:hypothetical protein